MLLFYFLSMDHDVADLFVLDAELCGLRALLCGDLSVGPLICAAGLGSGDELAVGV